jgi:hypothetical protein
MWNAAQQASGGLFTASMQIDSDGEGIVWLRPTYPPELATSSSLRLGEALYQLRAALDACIYDAAVRDSGQDPPPGDDKLEFPICLTEDGYKSSGPKIKPLSDDHKAIVRSVQPCFRDTAPATLHRVIDCLHLLNEWARIDRHRHFHFLGHQADRPDIQFKVPAGVEMDRLDVTAEGFLDERMTVATFHVSGWREGMGIGFNPRIRTRIGISEEPRLAGVRADINDQANGLVDAVEHVLDMFERGGESSAEKPDTPPG